MSISISTAALIERLRNDTYHEDETSPNGGPCEPNERRAWNSAMRHVEMVIVPELLTSTARPAPLQVAVDRAGSAGASYPPDVCPHCAAGESSVWDSVFDHYAHPDLANPGKLKFCHHPWRAR